MTTHKQRMLAAMRGEEVDRIPFAPRLDLWWIGNAFGGGLPERFQGMKPDDISREYGWACYHMVPDFTNMMRGPEDILHRALGLFQFRQSAYTWEFPKDVSFEVREEDGLQVIEYQTPKGTVRTVGGHTEEMKKKGASLGWTREHIIKTPEDYAPVAYIFENMEVAPNYEGCKEYIDEVGDCGVVAVGGPSLGGSPMHHIQKEFIDQTQFFFEYKDNYDGLVSLAESVGHYFDKVLEVIAGSPAEVVMWGANYDDMLTWPPYFEEQILPWLQKASARLSEAGIITATHTDGENQGLMDLVPQSGCQVAESITPAPMTKVPPEEYYSRWSDRMTLMGMIPECLLLPETSKEEELDAYMYDLFMNVKPGRRLILGVADSVPPGADWSRLEKVGEKIEKEGGLPL